MFQTATVRQTLGYAQLLGQTSAGVHECALKLSNSFLIVHGRQSESSHVVNGQLHSGSAAPRRQRMSVRGPFIRVEQIRNLGKQLVRGRGVSRNVRLRVSSPLALGLRPAERLQTGLIPQSNSRQLRRRQNPAHEHASNVSEESSISSNSCAGLQIRPSASRPDLRRRRQDPCRRRHRHGLILDRNEIRASRAARSLRPRCTTPFRPPSELITSAASVQCVNQPCCAAYACPTLPSLADGSYRHTGQGRIGHPSASSQVFRLRTAAFSRPSARIPADQPSSPACSASAHCGLNQDLHRAPASRPRRDSCLWQPARPTSSVYSISAIIDVPGARRPRARPQSRMRLALILQP